MSGSRVRAVVAATVQAVLVVVLASSIAQAGDRSCCFPNGKCVYPLSNSNCMDAGGLFATEIGIMCAEANCPQPDAAAPVASPGMLLTIAGLLAVAGIYRVRRN
jgi:hypothetical protein